MPQRRLHGHGIGIACGHRVVRSALLVTLAALALSALSGCQVAFGPQVTISGVVYGEQIAARQAGKSLPVALLATVTCNGTSAPTDGRGAYTLTVARSASYSCAATAPNYARAAATTTETDTELSITLDFGPDQALACSTDAPGKVSCDLLQPAMATLRGTVTNADNDKAITAATVRCWNTSQDVAPSETILYTTQTSDLGYYVFHNLPVGPYSCTGDTDETLHATVLAPGQMTTLDIPACVQDCSSFKYHNGSVVHNLTAYLIFWLPNGHTFEPNGSSSRYQHLIEQYFQDVGGTSFYNILTQYYDFSFGPVHNVVTLGDTYLDTRPYPRAGTESHPLLDSDITDEISQVVTAKSGSWSIDPDHIVFVFTGYGVQECTGSRASDGCTFTHAPKNDFCAYHSYQSAIDFGGRYDLIYAYMPDVESCLNLPTGHSPNGDSAADAVIISLSHEQFEAVSDPALSGWYDDVPHDGEMADKCERSYGPIRADGSNVTLAHGHRYIVQEEWSLRDQGCVLSLASASGG